MDGCLSGWEGGSLPPSIASLSTWQKPRDLFPEDVKTAILQNHYHGSATAQQQRLNTEIRPYNPCRQPSCHGKSEASPARKDLNIYWNRSGGVPNSPKEPTQVLHRRSSGQQALPRHLDKQELVVAEESLQQKRDQTRKRGGGGGGVKLEGVK